MFVSGHFVTFTDCTTTEGIPILISPSACSVSPSHGDQRITGHLLYRDLLKRDLHKVLPFGLLNILFGTKDYFVVLMVDTGYVYQPKKMKADKYIGNLHM